MNFRNRMLSNDPWPLWQDAMLLVLRIASGMGMFLLHGVRKWDRLFTSEGPIKFGDPLGVGPEISLYLAIFSEVICALLLVLGFRTRLATIPLIITMLVIVLRVHWSDPLADKELPLLYLVSYFALFVWGAGKYSIDRMFYSK